MSGTKEGGRKAAATNKLRFGDDFYSNIGRKGGRAEVCKGFGTNPELAREAGRKGGTISRRGRNLAAKKIYKDGEKMTQILVKEIHTPAQKVRVYNVNY